MTPTEPLVRLNESGGILDQQLCADRALLGAHIIARGGGRVPPQHPHSFPERAVSVGPRVGTIMDSEAQFGHSDLCGPPESSLRPLPGIGDGVPMVFISG